MNKTCLSLNTGKLLLALTSTVFLVLSPMGLTTISYYLTALGAFQTLVSKIC
jgi:hypothetical protein